MVDLSIVFCMFTRGYGRIQHVLHVLMHEKWRIFAAKTCKTSPDFTKNEDLTTRPEMSYLTSSVVPGPTFFGVFET